MAPPQWPVPYSSTTTMDPEMAYGKCTIPKKPLLLGTKTAVFRHVAGAEVPTRCLIIFPELAYHSILF